MKSNKKHDYLKYWRAVRQYMKVKHGVGQADLDMLLFLYSEGFFTREKFDEFNSLLAWDRNRFEDLQKDGWIESYRNVMNGKRKRYTLSFKATRMIDTIYRILEGEEIPVKSDTNPMFKKNVSYTDKVYRHFIMELRKATRQPPRPSTE